MMSHLALVLAEARAPDQSPDRRRIHRTRGSSLAQSKRARYVPAPRGFVPAVPGERFAVQRASYNRNRHAGVIEQVEVSGGARYESLDELIAAARAELGFRVGSASAGERL